MQALRWQLPVLDLLLGSLLRRQGSGALGLLRRDGVRLPSLQLFLLLLQDDVRGLQLLDQLLIRFGQLADFIAQAEQVLRFTAQAGEFRVLRLDVGSFALVQFGAQLPDLLFGITRFGLGRVLLLIGRKEEKFADYQRDNTQPENPAFQCHGQTPFRLFDRRRQIGNSTRGGRAGLDCFAFVREMA